MLWLIGTYLALLLLDPAIDGLRKKRKWEITIFHGRESWIVAGIYMVSGLLIAKWQHIPFRHLLSMWIILVGIRWIVHDLVFNAVMRLPWDYVGSTAKIDIWLQKQQEHPILYKLTVLILSIGIALTLWI